MIYCQLLLITCGESVEIESLIPDQCCCIVFLGKTRLVSFMLQIDVFFVIVIFHLFGVIKLAFAVIAFV